LLFEKYGIVTLRFKESAIYENHHKMEKKIKKAIEDIDKTRRVFASKLAKKDEESDCF
jgi:predicted glycosyltransferase